MKFVSATVYPRIFRITLALAAGLVVYLIAVNYLKSPPATFEIESCSDSRCLAIIAAQSLKDGKDVGYEHLAEIAQNLARAGLFDEARAAADQISPNEPKSLYYRESALREIAFSQVAAAAWMDPQRLADLGPVDALATRSSSDPSLRTASDYWLLAERILNRSPYTGVSLDLADLLHPKVIRREQNVTLIELLHTRWPNIIDTLPERKRGTYWNYFAQVWLEIGNLRAATDMLDRAETSGAHDFNGVNVIYESTARNWLKMGRLDRALTAARSASSKSAAAAIQIDLAKALIISGNKEEALAILVEALANARSVSHSRISFLRSILNLRLDAGDRVGARQIADESLALAREPDIFPAGQLASAAGAYNDIGERQRAAEILHDAIAKVPSPDRLIGIGVTIGPIFGSTLGVVDSIRSQIAVQLYRAGDREGFKTLQRDVTPWYRERTWIDLYTVARRRGEAEPSESEVLNELQDDSKLRFLNILATNALLRRDADTTAQLLRRVLMEARTESHIRILTETAKIAVASDFSEIAPEALHIAARIALRIDDTGRRAVQLSFVAALLHELLGL